MHPQEPLQATIGMLARIAGHVLRTVTVQYTLMMTILDDVTWETDFELRIPTELKSGCYGVLVDDGKSTDIIPFLVRPSSNASNVPPVAVIMPTHIYW